MSRIKRVHCGDVNCHLVQGEQGAILVDTGRAGYGEKLLPLCRQWDVRLIVLTHGHLDHWSCWRTTTASPCRPTAAWAG